MINVQVVGINHKMAPVHVRERISFPEEKLGEAAVQARTALGVSEAVVLSTCNRVEVYLTDEAPAKDRVMEFLARAHGVEATSFAATIYHHSGADAVRHLFRVACGLDSMVVGETQVLGQVKRSYLKAQEAGSTGKLLNKLFQYALYVAKSVHAQSTLASGNVSVSSVAAGLAEKIFSSLAHTTVLVVGAGETATLTVSAFRDRGVRNVLVANRTLDRAEELARQWQGRALPLERIREAMEQVDVVVSCIQHPSLLVTAADVEAALRRRRGTPMFLIDISVPRNLDPEIDRLDNAYLYNIDDLESIAADNLARREQEVTRCEALVEQETRRFLAGAAMLDIDHILTQLQGRVNVVVEEELKSLAPERREEMERVIRKIVGKLVHPSMSSLRDGVQTQATADLIRKIFGLE